MVKDVDLELISLMELKEIKREKRLNEAAPQNTPQISGSKDMNSPSDHFGLIIDSE